MTIDMNNNICYYCSIGKHKYCRGIKLDFNICQCNCSISSDFRKDYDLQMKLFPNTTKEEVIKNYFGKKRLTVLKKNKISIDKT